MVLVDIKVPVTKKRETLEVERGKPRKRETQIMVGEPLLVNERCSGPAMVDKYLPRFLTDRTRLISYYFFIL